MIRTGGLRSGESHSFQVAEGLYLIWGWQHGSGYSVSNTIAFTNKTTTFNGYSSGNASHTLFYFPSTGTMVIKNNDEDPFPYVVVKITQ